jgi:hypothetical protein
MSMAFWSVIDLGTCVACCSTVPSRRLHQYASAHCSTVIVLLSRAMR